MHPDQIQELERTLPPIIARTAVHQLTGGLISTGRLANLDSLGQGPKRIRVGRKVAYLRSDFTAWLASRTSEAA
ncbi:helix-turn-helix transcriptional regulator [Desulfovibrio sp. Fe33]|uniref:helix-turn-helix transcriptional regulator n=1 Tax=Desulfovibrio sp. Fe33 TaxID=3020842 RepID=UPI00234DF117|nr:hypothetical protein [Desulfovibrio sp. Fe33]